MNERLQSLRSIFEGRGRRGSNPKTVQDPLISPETAGETTATTPTTASSLTPLLGDRKLGPEDKKLERMGSVLSPNSYNERKGFLTPRSSSKNLHGKSSAEEDTLSDSDGSGDSDSEEALILEAIRNADYDLLVELVNDEDVDANALTCEGNRYLHECVSYDDAQACEILLAAGAQINARDEYGWTGLHFAAVYSLPNMITFLLDRGADPRKKSRDGQMAEELADDPAISQQLQISRSRRGLRSVSTISMAEIEQAAEEVRRKQEKRTNKKSEK